MRGLWVAAFVSLSALALPQQGGGLGGGFGMGGRSQGNQGFLDAVTSINQGVAQYLNGDETKNILTPGEYSEWKLDLKAGQVVIAEARSDAFDPALEIVDDAGKAQASNDDRFPGDQRPLLLWRCEKAGSYALHVRCFHDKSGGQFSSRFRIFNSLDLSSSDVAERDLAAGNQFLIRIPMKAGQVKELLAMAGDEQHRYIPFRQVAVIYPNGLPQLSPSLSDEVLKPAFQALVAPVAGDYYILSEQYDNGRAGKVKVGTREIVPVRLATSGGNATSSGMSNIPAIWELSVKAGDLVEVSAPDLLPDTRFKVAAAPDFSKYDVSKPETNPFFPPLKPNLEPEEEGEPLIIFPLPARSRDGRISVFHVNKDAKVWIASTPIGVAPDRPFTLRVRPAAADFPEGKLNSGKLRIGSTDYWQIDAKAGDVMTIDSTSDGFAQHLKVRDPIFNDVWDNAPSVDKTSQHTQIVIQRPGAYLVAMSCLGDGGSGDYTLIRKVYHPTEFSSERPAKGEIEPGQVQVWRFDSTPDKPLLVHWTASAWNFGVSVYDEKGNRANLPMQPTDDHNQFGILKVNKEQSFVIVLTGYGAKTSYSIQLDRLPGNK